MNPSGSYSKINFELCDHSAVTYLLPYCVANKFYTAKLYVEIRIHAHYPRTDESLNNFWSLFRLFSSILLMSASK